MTNEIVIDRVIKLLALLTVAYAAMLAVQYAGQPLLELFGFRQTQTALTSYWFMKEGFKFAYETPVSGAPWSIPFEFPIYQALVTLIAEALHADIGKTGRILSFVFLVLCLVPARAICRSLDFAPRTFYIFTGLLLSSPLYIFWGRTFMIETLTVFLAVASIKYFIDFLKIPSTKHMLCFTALISLSILQKATTGLPVLAVLAFTFLFHEIHGNTEIRKVVSIQNIARCFLLFAVPIIIGFAWTHYTDVVKEHNAFGAHLTSSALSKWNWGSLAQRFSPMLYGEVIWSRIIKGNLSGAFGVAIIGYGICMARSVSARFTIVACVSLALLPLFLFSNLHIVHIYYQSANVIFLIFALAVALSEAGERDNSKCLTLALFVALVINNYSIYFHGYREKLEQQIDMTNSMELLVADTLKHNMKDGEAFTLFGNDWSSSISYYAEHKSFAVPNRFSKLDEVIESPQQFLGSSPLGAIAVCPEAQKPTLAQLIDMKHDGTDWKTAEVSTCYISFPQKPIHLEYPSVPANCTGSLDSAGPTTQKTQNAIEVKGWTAVDINQNLMPEEVYVTLKDGNGKLAYYDAVQYAHMGVKDFYKRPDLGNAGFGRVIDTRNLSGHYTVGITRVFKKQLQVCQFSKEIEVNIK